MHVKGVSSRRWLDTPLCIYMYITISTVFLIFEHWSRGGGSMTGGKEMFQSKLRIIDCPEQHEYLFYAYF